MQQLVIWTGLCLAVLVLCVLRPNAGRIFLGAFFLVMAIGASRRCSTWRMAREGHTRAEHGRDAGVLSPARATTDNYWGHGLVPLP
jgi:hypothetical protein